VDEPCFLNEFPRVTETYIKYEQKMYTDNLKNSRKQDLQVESSHRSLMEKKNEGKPKKEGRLPIGGFDEYTPFAVSRDKILVECTSTCF